MRAKQTIHTFSNVGKPFVEINSLLIQSTTFLQDRTRLVTVQHPENPWPVYNSAKCFSGLERKNKVGLWYHHQPPSSQDVPSYYCYNETIVYLNHPFLPSIGHSEVRTLRPVLQDMQLPQSNHPSLIFLLHPLLIFLLSLLHVLHVLLFAHSSHSVLRS